MSSFIYTGKNKVSLKKSQSKNTRVYLQWNTTQTLKLGWKKTMHGTVAPTSTWSRKWKEETPSTRPVGVLRAACRERLTCAWYNAAAVGYFFSNTNMFQKSTIPCYRDSRVHKHFICKRVEKTPPSDSLPWPAAKPRPPRHWPCLSTLTMSTGPHAHSQQDQPPEHPASCRDS
jgi:hypothetical protein